jgi:hypothetical protein
MGFNLIVVLSQSGDGVAPRDVWQEHLRWLCSVVQWFGLVGPWMFQPVLSSKYSSAVSQLCHMAHRNEHQKLAC